MCEVISHCQLFFAHHVNFRCASGDDMADWAIRLDRKRKELGWSKAELARRADVPAPLLRRYLTDEIANPRGDILKRLAAAVDVDEIWLRHGQGPETLDIPLVGYTAAGESWIAFDGVHPGASAHPGAGAHADPHATVSLTLAGADPVAIEVRGSSMAPVYRAGDRLLCSRMRGIDLEDVLGKDCVVCTLTGDRLIKQVYAGRDKNTFRLRSYNPDFEDIEGAHLEWAAPVIWIKRG